MKSRQCWLIITGSSDIIIRFICVFADNYWTIIISKYWANNYLYRYVVIMHFLLVFNHNNNNDVDFFF